MACEGATTGTCSQFTSMEARWENDLTESDALDVLESISLDGSVGNTLTFSWDTATAYADQTLRVILRDTAVTAHSESWFEYAVERDDGSVVFSGLTAGHDYMLAYRIEDADEANEWEIIWFTYVQDVIVDPNQVFFDGVVVTHQGETITS